MQKILINLFSNKLSEESFHQFSSDYFLEYDIYNYQFSIEEMFPDIIEAIVKQIVEENKYKLAETKIVFQTNVVDLGHFTSKVYSEIIDAVVLVGDKIEILTETVNELTFMNKIIQQKYPNYRLLKVFLRESIEQDIDYIMFLFENKLFNDIAPISEFQLNEEPKIKHNYCYDIGVGEYSTSINCLTNETIIIFCNEIKKPYNVSEIIEPYGIFKILNLLLEHNFIGNEQKYYLIDMVCNNIREIKKEKELTSIIFRYLDSTTQNLEDYINYTYICMATGNQQGLKRIYKYIEKKIDSLDMINVHAFITNSLLYVSKLNQNSDKEIVRIRLKLMSQLKKYWSKKITLPNIKDRKENHIAIVAGQLIGLNHAPTKWAIDYANALKKYNPKLKIKIFVEDCFKYSPGELTWLYQFESIVSKSSASLHQEALANGIEVYYSDNNLKRENRLNKDIKAILDFKPSVIYKMGSKYNLATDLLYDYYPIVSHTMGGPEDSEFVDIFTGGYYNDVMYKVYEEFNITHQTYMHHRVSIETPKKKVVIQRSDLNLLDSDFILITVGNRLNVEVTKEFVEQIVQVLEKDLSVKWFIIGVERITLINNIYSKYIENKQIIFINYERNLFDFYDICNVYVNPIRNTGGISGAWAMKAKLPIVTTDVDSDIGGMVGIESCLDIGDFTDEILLLKNDTQYYKEKSEEMFERIEQFNSIQNTMGDLMHIFKESIGIFKKRKKN